MPRKTNKKDSEGGFWTRFPPPDLPPSKITWIRETQPTALTWTLTIRQKAPTRGVHQGYQIQLNSRRNPRPSGIQAHHESGSGHRRALNGSAEGGYGLFRHPPTSGG